MSVLPARWGTAEESQNAAAARPLRCPLMCDVVGKNRIRVGTVVTQGQGWIASRNLIRHVAKVGKGRRVTGGVKAGSAVRVGGRRVTSVMGAGSQINMNLVGQEFGHHSENGKCPISPRAGPLKRTCETPGTRRSQMTCPIPEAEGRGRKECPIIHQKACHRYFPHSQLRP